MELKILVILIVMSSSAAQEVKNLTSTEGGSITLPDPILKLGFLLYGGSNVALVINSEISVVDERFRNRVFWDKNTGLFTIRGLQRNDSGIYSVDSKTKGVLTSYRLTVYESVPEPGVNRSSVSAESCTLLCFVKKSEATTLSWYRGEEILNQSRTAASLPLTVHKHNFSSSYRCEAANPAENKSFPVNFTTSCSENIINHSRSGFDWSLPLVVGIVASVLCFVIFIILTARYCMTKRRKTDRHSEGSVNREEEVLYADVTIIDYRARQGNTPDSTPVTDRANLTTVYDKLEVHRMAQTNADIVQSMTT